MADPGAPTMTVPVGLSEVIVSAAYHIMLASLSVRKVETKSRARVGMKMIVCVAKGAKSNSVVDVVSKQA